MFFFIKLVALLLFTFKRKRLHIDFTVSYLCTNKSKVSEGNSWNIALVPSVYPESYY